jgi:hypothetical protein
MKILAVLLLGIALDVSRAASQSCPAADSVFSTVTKKRFERRYDRMTDTTTLLGSPRVIIPMSGNEKSLMLLTAFAGEQANGNTASLLEVAMTLNASNGGRGRITELTKDHGVIAEAEEALLLTDTGTRIRLPRVTYASKLGKSVMTGPYLHERARFAVTPEQLANIGRASEKVDVRIGAEMLDLKSKEIESARELYRFVVCAR